MRNAITPSHLLWKFVLGCALVALAATCPARAQWVQFQDETATRLSAAAGLGSADPDEKDFAWGDVDKDGDIDLVVVRKEPATSDGKRVNVLFLNINGVLTDSTAAFVTDASVVGDQGFLTATNDRDVKLVDLNGDTWLDMVTAVTLSDNDPKAIGHPRIYINQKSSGGVWQGFRYEESLFPPLNSYDGSPGFQPRFCSIGVGDINGDLRPDLWFGDYDSSGVGGGSPPPEGSDFNDRLLLNTPSNRFVDATSTTFSGLIEIPTSADTPFEISAFGAAAAIADMNGDGFLDIVKQTALQAPQYVGISYNDPDNEGFFDNHEVVDLNAPYFVSVGDLNNDTRLDMVITDDGQDRFWINDGTDVVDNRADFTAFTFSYDGTGDDGFGSNSLIADLDNDGWQDVLIADFDVDEAGCNRRMHIFHNQGGNPGDNVDLREETGGSGCANGSNPASCLIASIPADQLTGVHDVAAFDINGDSFLDLVIGRCAGTSVWMQVPPFGVDFSYPNGLPTLLNPGVATTFQVQLTANGGATIDPGSEEINISVNGAAFSASALTDLGGGLYEATIPAQVACLDEVRFYLSADVNGGAVTSLDPATAPFPSYTAVAAFDTSLILNESFEGDTSAWTVQNDVSLANGSWEVGDPNGTLTNGNLANPEDDSEPDPNVNAFVTDNGVPGGTAGQFDVDFGPTDLISPPFDISGNDAIVTFDRWFFTSGDDAMEIAVSADGTNWNVVRTITGSESAWVEESFQVSSFITPSATTQVRIRVSDNPNNSITEGGVDHFRVEAFVCAECVLNTDCADGDFCNGDETCDNGTCVAGGDPCPGQACDEGTDICIECVTDGDCADGDFCNGNEVCLGNTCQAGTDPCPGSLCDDISDSCVVCLLDADCDDGQFCNGAETCNGGACSGPVDACPGQTCDEVGDTCVGSITLQPRLGEPLAGLTVDELNRFEAGAAAFNQPLIESSGLGPIFNQNSCGSCHNNPLGGSGSILVTRFGFNDEKAGGFDSLDSLGGSLLQAQTTDAQCQESVPPVANVIARRATPSTLGFGLVEAIPDAAIEANAIVPPAGVSGRAIQVPVFEDPGNPKVGRFGWKNQVATVLTFSADAAQNEMGLTNRFLPTENAPNGNAALLPLCDFVADPEDGPDAEGFDFIDRVTDFQRFLAAPPQTPRAGTAGEGLFSAVQCSSCHTPSFATPDDPGLELALRNQVISPYSDFLLHDMGQSADFIEQGDATSREIRTTPLWGIRVRTLMWHDGRVNGGSFADRIRESINLHDAPGSEGAASAQAFNALTTFEQDELISFLDSLGRAEFDHDGDNDVDLADHTTFQSCFTGPGGSLTADDPCAISDVDQDGDVDDDDFALFDMAVNAPAGTVDGLQLDKVGADLTLTWGASCATGDSDYAIYEGTMGDYSSHASQSCSTGGATTDTFTAPSGDVYYLIVPQNALREGSYGLDSAGGQRVQGGGACATRATGICG